jgi:dTDP-4-amino-4,6-dideoxygalactose transaminase
MPTCEDVESKAAKAVTDYLRLVERDPKLVDAHLLGTSAVGELERKLCDFYGAQYALCVSNATVGLWAIAKALDLVRAEFLTTPYTYGASLAGLMMLDNRVVFADIDPLTLTLDPESARRAITPTTKALLAVDILGNPSDMIALRDLADHYGLWYIADAAQSFGARRDGFAASAKADAWVVSFSAGKPLFAGEGGVVLTNNQSLYDKVVYYTQHPARQRREIGLHLFNELALNGRIHPLAVVWANAVFEESLEKLRAHQQKCQRVIEVLNGCGLTDSIGFLEREIEPSFFRLSAAWRGEPRENDLAREMQGQGFSVSIDTPPVTLLHRQTAFLAQYSRRFKVAPRCVEFERQVGKRFCIRTENTT